jgi:hypothetical protein
MPAVGVQEKIIRFYPSDLVKRNNLILLAEELYQPEASLQTNYIPFLNNW